MAVDLPTSPSPHGKPLQDEGLRRRCIGKGGGQSGLDDPLDPVFQDWSDNEALFRDLVQHNLRFLRGSGFKTLVALFCPDLITPTQYARRRKLPPHLALAILLRLGFPGSNTPVQRKRQIIESADGSYRSLRESIRRFQDRFGIQAATFKTLHVFPLEIARKMREQYS